MSGKWNQNEWNPFRASTKEHKEKVYSDKHGAPKNYGQRSSSSSKGGSGHAKQPSNRPVSTSTPITLTSAATKPKVEVSKRVDLPSDKDLKYPFDTLVGDSQGRRDSKGEVEYYREQYRKLKVENETWRDKVEDLSAELECAQNRVRVKNETIAEINDLVNKKDKELNQLRKAQDDLDGKLQQLIEEKASLEKQMQAGYKEREDRTEELEEFIYDQVIELDKMEAALKQTLANKEIVEKELNEALEKKQAELTALQVAYEEKENKISQSVSPVYDDKQESSHVSSELSQAEEKLAEANQQLLAYKEEIQKLKEGALAKQDEVHKLLASNKKMEGVLDNYKVELSKLEEMISKLKENEASNLGVEKNHEELMLQSNADKLTVEFKQATETVIMTYCTRLVQEIKDQEKKAVEALQSQLLRSQNKVDELTKELTVETEKFKKLVEDHEKRFIAQEEKISQLDSAFRQSTESASKKIRTLESDREALIQSNQKMSREVARLLSVDNDLLNLQTENEKYKLLLHREENDRGKYKSELLKAEKEIEKCKVELRKAEEKLAKEELHTKEFLIETDNLKGNLKQLEINRKTQEQQIKVLQAQLEKALDPLENIEELKEVEDLGEEIGRGSYGVVKKVSLHGTVCAAKDIHAILIHYASGKELERIKKSFLEECVKSSKLFHPNIVQFLGIHYPSKQAKLPWLVMELLDCSLAGFVKKYDNESVTLLVKASIFCDISLGLQFLHGRDIIHRDLSSNNVLLTKHLTAKISDLGVAKLVDPSGTKSHTVAPGTQHFLPPEVISDAAKSHYGKPIDIFSLGCIMIHVTTHEWPAPLPETHYDPKLKKKVALSEIERRETYLKQIQELPELKVLVESCLHDDPGLRPNATKMVDEVGKLKILYQKNSSLVGNEMNAVEFEQRLKFQDKRISEQQLEIQKLNKTIQEAHKPLQGSYLICHKCNRQFREGQLPEYRHHIDNCRH